MYYNLFNLKYISIICKSTMVSVEQSVSVIKRPKQNNLNPSIITAIDIFVLLQISAIIYMSSLYT